MNILFLSQRFLLPLDSGGKIRTAKILENLSRKCNITLVSNVNLPRDRIYFSQIKKLCSKFIPIERKEIPKYSIKYYLKILYYTFSKYPIIVMNDYCKKLENAILKEIYNESYDILICDFVQSSLNVRKVKGPKKVLFQHNVESIIAKRHYIYSNKLMKLFWWIQWKKMYYFEKNFCSKYDAIIAISENDKVLFKELYNLDNIYTIPTGVDTIFFAPLKNVKPLKNSLVFCGSMDWLPNEDAVIYFVDQIYPKIRAHISDISFTIVGKNPSPRLRKQIKKYSEIKLTGWVEDVRPYIARASLYIVPLRIGGGTRIKIFEAMAMEKAVVSTSIGAEGLPVKNGEHIILADTPEKFAEAVIFLLKNPDFRYKIAHNARNYILKNFDWSIVAEKFWQILHHIKQLK